MAAAEVQKKLLDFSRERGIEYCCGQGIGYHLLMERGLSAGEIVICGGRHAATVGAVGAVGLCLSPAELKEALETDVVSLDGAPLLGVHLAGELSPCVTARDLALTMAASGPVCRGAGGHPGITADRFPAGRCLRPSGGSGRPERVFWGGDPGR